MKILNTIRKNIHNQCICYQKSNSIATLLCIATFFHLFHATNTISINHNSVHTTKHFVPKPSTRKNKLMKKKKENTSRTLENLIRLTTAEYKMSYLFCNEHATQKRKLDIFSSSIYCYSQIETCF